MSLATRNPNLVKQNTTKTPNRVRFSVPPQVFQEIPIYSLQSPVPRKSRTRSRKRSHRPMCSDQAKVSSPYYAEEPPNLARSGPRGASRSSRSQRTRQRVKIPVLSSPIMSDCSDRGSPASSRECGIAVPWVSNESLVSDVKDGKVVYNIPPGNHGSVLLDSLAKLWNSLPN